MNERSVRRHLESLETADLIARRIRGRRKAYRLSLPPKTDTESSEARADPHRMKRGGYHTWTDAEIERFREIFPTGSKPRLALELLLATGASRLDAVGLTRANIQGGRITFRRAKTSVAVDLPLLPALGRELALLPSTQMVLLALNDGETGYAVESFGILFRRWCNEAGVPGSAHGLRKAGARRLAEAGATEFEVMSFSDTRAPRRRVVTWRLRIA